MSDNPRIIVSAAIHPNYKADGQYDAVRFRFDWDDKRYQCGLFETAELSHDAVSALSTLLKTQTANRGWSFRIEHVSDLRKSNHAKFVLLRKDIEELWDEKSNVHSGYRDAAAFAKTQISDASRYAAETFCVSHEMDQSDDEDSDSDIPYFGPYLNRYGEIAESRKEHAWWTAISTSERRWTCHLANVGQSTNVDADGSMHGEHGFIRWLKVSLTDQEAAAFIKRFCPERLADSELKDVDATAEFRFPFPGIFERRDAGAVLAFESRNERNKQTGTVADTDDGPSDARVAIQSTNELILTDIHMDVLQALDGCALKVESIATKIGRDKSSLYRPYKVLAELKDAGRIVYDTRIGYYRPDRKPPDVFVPVKPVNTRDLSGNESPMA